MHNIESKLKELFTDSFGESPYSIERLPVSGSARCYYRLKGSLEIFNNNKLVLLNNAKEFSCIATWNNNVQENIIFLDFTKHFAKASLNVPQIYSVSKDKKYYLQQDLGDITLLNLVEQQDSTLCEYKGVPSDSEIAIGNTPNIALKVCDSTRLLNDNVISFYKKSLLSLVQLQIKGGEDLDYSLCVPRSVFDERCVMWDLNYFKYCFLKLIGSDLDEDKLENDFEKLSSLICSVSQDVFMFRDFQSRNIMVFQDEIFFIDYQGGRLGTIYYDVASLLYDPIVNIPDSQRELLLDYYISQISKYRTIDRLNFKKNYYNFVLLRLLQALGAFGLRGLYEKKQHFIDSIQPGIVTLLNVLNKEEIKEQYPEILNSCKKIELNMICTKKII